MDSATRREGLEEIRLRAIVVVDDHHEVSMMVKSLEKQGLATTVRNDPNEALDECRRNPPNLVIVEKTMVPMTGPRFLAELLKVSWTTSTILIADEDAEVLHQETEGLGILGSIRTVDDVEGLERLMDIFLEMLSPAPRTGS
jgi:PleD family two-component response regulator